MRILANLLGLFMAVFGVFLVIGSYAMPRIDVQGVSIIVVLGIVLTGAGGDDQQQGITQNLPAVLRAGETDRAQMQTLW